MERTEDTVETLTAEFADRLNGVFHRNAMTALGGLAVAGAMMSMARNAPANGAAKLNKASFTKAAKRVVKVASTTKKPRKKGPIQLCPVPKCTNRAAPVFGMVCSKHKDVKKSVIAKYRADRAAKNTAKSGAKK